MNIELTENFQFLFRPKTFKIMFGGRYGMKTTAAIRALLYQAASKQIRILCCREYMQSIDASVHEAMKGEIETLKMSNLFQIYYNRIESKNGTQIIYSGLARDPKGIKSTYKLDRAFVEEGESLSQRSLDDLIPTIIREPGSELWIVFNPEDEYSPVWQRFIAPFYDEILRNGHYEDDNHYIIKTNYWENPFLSKEAYEEAERLKRENYRKWKWIYGGFLYADYQDSIIKPEWIEAAIDAHEKLNWKPLGVKSVGFDLADTGDAKALVLRHGSVITHGEQWKDGELPDALDRGFERCSEWDADSMVYDDDGLGKSMKVYLSKVAVDQRLRVVPYNGNAPVDNPKEIYDKDTKKTNEDTFRNKRAQYYAELADRFEATYNALEKNIYTDPDNMISLSSNIKDLPILKSELSKIKRKRTNNTLFQVQSKKDAIAEGIKSPNLADSLCMCFANPLLELAGHEHIELNFTSEFA